jgi:hypothetical protein
MIPRTFPSSVASNGSRQMIVYFLPSVSGLTRWVDYIPVKFTTVATAATENTYNQNGYIPVVSLSSIAGATPFKEYVPVFLDSSAADADVWDVTITGFIPVGTAGIGGAALYLDFAATTSLDPRITFSRTTNATVTGSNGLIRNAPMNLLTFSEQFDNAVWVKTGSTVSANNTAAPNGTITADKLVETAATGIHEILQPVNVANGAISVNFYAKAAERSKFRLDMTDLTSGDSFADFDLTSVSATSGSNGSWSNVSTTIVSAGDGWYRCNMTATKGAGTTVGVKFQLNNGGGISYAGTAGSGLFIWGAQLEVGSTATTYNPTTVKNLLGYTEHFDNAAWTKSNAFVQTNLFTYSQDFDNAAWTTSGATVTANNAIAPDGTLTADTIASASGFAQYLQQSILATAGQQITYSFYILKTAATVDGLYGGFSVEFRTESTPLAEYGATINSDSGSLIAASGWGTAGFASSSVIDAGAYWRVIAVPPAAPATTTVVRVYHGVAGYFLNGTRLGTGSSSKVLWGAQLVLGTSAGDYKATYAAAAAVGYTDIYGQPFAQKLVESATAAEHRCFGPAVNVTAGAPSVFSFYAKAAERSVVAAAFTGPGVSNSVVGCYINLTTQAVTNFGAAPTSTTVTAIGNDWYRISLLYTATATAAIYPQVYTIQTAGTISYTGDGTSGIYIFGAQLSDSASVDPYVYQPVAAPTSTAYYGPRFDYDPVTLAPKGLLIEEQRTNLCLYSESFQSGPWTQNNATDIANSTVAPNGTTTADTLVASVGTAAHTITSGALNPAAGIAASVYAKMGTASVIQLFIGGTATPYANFDLSVGTATAFGSGTAASITPVGNGWYRCVMTTTLTTATSLQIGIVPSTSSARAASWTATGTETVFIWGAQLEAGAFATSYIPTVASQVTRAADSASMIGNNFARWYNQTEGSFFASMDYMSATTTAWVLASHSGVAATTNDYLAFVKNSGAAHRQTIVASGASQGNLDVSGAVAGVVYKYAGCYKTNDAAFTVGGATPLTDSTVTLPVPNSLQVGNLFNQYLNGHIQRLAYYPRRLANSELQSITS